MAMLVADPRMEDRLKAERKASGADRYDEVWEGVYMMTPMPNNEHQEMVLGLALALQEIIKGADLGRVFPGVNLSDRRGDDWDHNYRVPDIAVFLRGGRAEDCGTHWCGAADFLVEITSPGDRTREKLPFYSRLGVLELLVVDRESWTLELYRWKDGQLQSVGKSTGDAAEVLGSETIPVKFRLVAGAPRPQIEVTHSQSDRRWLI